MTSTTSDAHLTWCYGRGLNAATLSAFCVGSCPAHFFHKMRDRVIIPLRYLDGEFAGYTGRIVSDRKDTPKYLHDSDMQKSLTLTGLHQSWGRAQRQRRLFLTEGPMDALLLYQYGLPAAWVNGAKASLAQAMAAALCVDYVVWWADSDEAGVKAGRANVETLSRFCRADMLVNPHGKDVGDLVRACGPRAAAMLWEAVEVYCP